VRSCTKTPVLRIVNWLHWSHPRYWEESDRSLTMAIFTTLLLQVIYSESCFVIRSTIIWASLTILSTLLLELETSLICRRNRNILIPLFVSPWGFSSLEGHNSNPNVSSRSTLTASFGLIYLVFLLAKCIDKYIALRNQEHEDPQNVEPMDPRLKDVVEKMFDRCYQDSEYKQVCRL